MNIYILSNREVVKNEVAGNNGENNAEVMNFHFPNQIVGIDMSTITKWIQFKNEELDLLQMIENDKYSLTDLITQYESVEYQVLLKYNELVLWKSNIAELEFGESLDIDVTITLDDLSVLNQLRLQVIDLKKQYEEAIKQGNTDLDDLIKRVEGLETKINDAEELRKTAETGRVTAENERVQAEQQRNETLRKLIENVENTIKNLAYSIEEYNQNAETQLSRLENTANAGVSDINSAKNVAINEIETEKDDSITLIQTEKANVIEAIGNEVKQRVTEIDNHIEGKTTEFDENAINKITNFDTNATSKITEFDTNATNKTEAYNNNANQKLEKFNSNFESKREEISSELSVERISTLENEVFDKESIISQSNSIMIEDSEEGLNIAINEIESNKLEQETSSRGKNITPTSKEFWESGHYDTNGKKVDFATRMRLIDFIECEPNTEYYASRQTYILRGFDKERNATINFGAVHAGNTFTTDENTYLLGVAIDKVYDEYDEELDKVMICKNSENNKTWEKGYVDMPSINYKSEVEGVTGDVNLKVQNKNILKSYFNNIDKKIYSQALCIEADLKSNTEYTITFKGTKGNSYYLNEYLVKKSNNFTATGDIQIITLETKEIMSKNLSLYIPECGWVLFKNNINQESENDFEVLQLEEGNQATDTVEHKEQEITLSLEEKTLYKGDRIIRKDGKWYFYKKYEKDLLKDINLTNWIKATNQNSKGLNVFFCIESKKMAKKKEKTDMYCNVFKYYENFAWQTSIKSAICLENDNTAIFITTNEFSTLEEFNNYINNNDIYCVYRIEPKAVEITDENLINQLNSILRLKQYNEITNIDFDNDVAFEINIDKSELKIVKEINENQNKEIEKLKEDITYKDKIISGILDGQVSETVEGDSMTIHDCLELPLKLDKIYGKPMKQDIREGYNKFNIEDGTYKSNNELYNLIVSNNKCFIETIDENNISNNASFLLKLKTPLKLTQGKSYTIVNGTNATYPYVNLRTNISNQYEEMTASDKGIHTFASADDVEINYLYVFYNTVNKLDCFPMLLEGSFTAETLPLFEQYGQSPSLEFPSPVEYIEGNQEIEHYTNLYNDKLDIVGKVVNLNTLNLQDNEVWTISEFIEVLPNIDVCFSYDVAKAGQLQISQYSESNTTKATTTKQVDFRIEMGNKITVKLNEDTKYIRVGYRNDLYHNKLLLNYGTKRLEYATYKESKTYQLTNLPPLYDESDYIYYNELLNKYFVHNDYDKYVITGNENWILSGNTTETMLAIALSNNLPFKALDGTVIDSYMNMFQNYNSIHSWKESLFNLYNPKDGFYNAFVITFDRSIYPDIESAKAKLKELYENGTPAYLIYKTKKEDTEITDKVLIDQLDKLREMFAYQGTNNIIVTAENGQSANLKLVAYKDGFKIIQDRLDEIMNAKDVDNVSNDDEEFIL